MNRIFTVILFAVILCPLLTLAQDIEVELIMPTNVYGPGTVFSLDLGIENNGQALNDAQVFVALSILSDFWFFPGWVHYPPDIDFETSNIAVGQQQMMILPEFSWPAGAGAFDGAMFFAAILHEGILVSNLATATWSWTETTPPTATPQATATPTNTPTPVPATATPTPDVPTPTSPPTPEGYVYIPAGTFTMGSPENEICRETDEDQHQVTLTRPILMGQTEVTRQMWADLLALQSELPDDPSFVDASPSMNHPVQYVTWFESVLFCNLKSISESLDICYYKDAAYTEAVDETNYSSGEFYCNFDANGYRLPTESEWEYACRAGTTGAFSFDEPDYSTDNCTECDGTLFSVLDQYCLFCGNHENMTIAAGSKLPNPWNLYEMHGNVWEWCWDWYGPYPTEDVTDPVGAETGTSRTRRGGAWRLNPQQCRSASRFIISPDYRFTFQGFRIVRLYEHF